MKENHTAKGEWVKSVRGEAYEGGWVGRRTNFERGGRVGKNPKTCIDFLKS
jgi:hypothetical protein